MPVTGTFSFSSADFSYAFAPCCVLAELANACNDSHVPPPFMLTSTRWSWPSAPRSSVRNLQAGGKKKSVLKDKWINASVFLMHVHQRRLALAPPEQLVGDHDLRKTNEGARERPIHQ
jgi:hypothetical protein